jgi:AGZA family xanthine/uracil permease-like MFS transporter
MHSYRWTASDTVMSLTPAWPWAVAYAAAGVFLLATPWLTVENNDG